ncbi:MAG: hypothetical protein ABSC23_17780 [Bryobacteraceae bacterium]|jgi:hypothetical protein
MRIKSQGWLAVLGVLTAAGLLAQDMPLPGGSINIKFPANSPVLLAGAVTDQSRAMARGAAMVIDLRLALLLRNVGPKPIHGVTLRVVAQEVALGGKGSVAYPSLHVAPGETFPARVEMELMRPTQAVNGPLVEVGLDGVLFQDLSFYGDDRMDSRRIMTAWEMEAQRDRAHFKRVLAQSGSDGLRTAMLESLSRQADRPRLDVRVVRGGPAVTSAANTASASGAVKFAFLQLPDSPITPTEGWAQVSGNEARAPRIMVQNTSKRTVKYVELGWLLNDRGGRRYLAASLPASVPDLMLQPGQTARVGQDNALVFSREGQPVNIQSIASFVSQVEFSDGQVWVPDRQSLQNASLLGLVAPSAEEQRLADLYRKKGINALVEELKKY